MAGAPAQRRAFWTQGWRSCEKVNNLTRRRQGAKTPKEQLFCLLRTFYDFVPPRGMKCLCSSRDYFTASGTLGNPAGYAFPEPFPSVPNTFAASDEGGH